jgi:hypothetical protein
MSNVSLITELIHKFKQLDINDINTPKMDGFLIDSEIDACDNS